MPQKKIASYRQLVLIECRRALSGPTPEIARKHEALADLYLSLIETLSRTVANDRFELPVHDLSPAHENCRFQAREQDGPKTDLGRVRLTSQSGLRAPLGAMN